MGGNKPSNPKKSPKSIQEKSPLPAADLNTVNNYSLHHHFQRLEFSRPYSNPVLLHHRGPDPHQPVLRLHQLTPDIHHNRRISSPHRRHYQVRRSSFFHFAPTASTVGVPPRAAPELLHFAGATCKSHTEEHYSLKDMDVDMDHYIVLGLPSGEEGAKLSEKEISKAYRAKALELHPDKRPDDPNAHANFQRLKSSYEILKDEKARKLFDDLLRVKLEKVLRQSKQDSKRRKMVSDLEERERAAFASDPTAKARDEEEMIARKLKEEIARIRAMHANKGATATSASKRETTDGKETMGTTGVGLDKEKVLKVSWEKIGNDYTAEKLTELFSKFGEVEDVVIKSSKKRGSALVVMANKEAAVAATGTVSGDLSNPLLVLPLQPALATESPSTQKSAEPDRNLVGAGYQAFEDAVLKKLQKAAEKQK